MLRSADGGERTKEFQRRMGMNPAVIVRTETDDPERSMMTIVSADLTPKRK